MGPPLKGEPGWLFRVSKVTWHIDVVMQTGEKKKKRGTALLRNSVPVINHHTQNQCQEERVYLIAHGPSHRELRAGTQVGQESGGRN